MMNLLHSNGAAVRPQRASVRGATALGICLLALGVLMSALSARPASAQTVEPAAAGQAKIDQSLRAELDAAAGSASFLVILGEQLDASAIVQGAGNGTDDALARRRAIYAALTAQARASQAGLRAWLDAQGVDYSAHYLVNMIEVRGNLALAESLARRPEVARLVRNPAVNGLQIDPHPQWQTLLTLPARAGAASLPYGLQDTNADDVWALGFRGQGIVVAGQDTGVVWDHPALLPIYRGWDSTTMTATHAYNWFDAWGRDASLDNECPLDAQIPCDDDLFTNHGTHTLGTVAGDATGMGDTIIGMAPDAKWIACRNMRDGFGTPASYTACFEFFLAPYPQGGDPMTDGKPELAPHVINNSWGCPPSEGCDATSLRQVVETMRAAGIYVAASAGNSGPNCGTVRSPIALHDAVTSVGAHDSNGVLAGFSSRGPVTVDGSLRPKPDLTAPGVSVRSLGRNDNINAYLSGTSMASPHVAGAVALLWSAVPTLTNQVDLTEQILLKSAIPVSDTACFCTGPAQSPNFTFGYGRLDVLGAVALASNPVTVTLQFSDTNGAPLAGVTVDLVDERTGFRYSQVTDAAGEVAWRGETPQHLLFSGEYGVEVAGVCQEPFTEQIRLAPGAEVQQAWQIDCTAGTDTGLAGLAGVLSTTAGMLPNTYCVWLPTTSK